MSASNKTNWFVRNVSICILVFVTLVCVGMEALKVNQKLDYRFYDFLSSLAKNPDTDEKILLIDIGDRSLSEYGEWPWTRDVIGNVMLRLKDLGARTCVFDIEYLSGSSLAADRNINDISSKIFYDGENDISQAFQNYAQYIREGFVETDDAVDAANEVISNSVDPVLFDMFQRMNDGLNRDFDAFFAKTLQFFGNASMTINMKDTNNIVDPDDIDYAMTRFLFGNVKDPKNLIARDNEYSFRETENADDKRGFVPAINKIISKAAGAGFTNVVVDNDGVRRRVELLNHRDGKYTGQLSFAPLVREMDVQEIVRGYRSITLKGAILPGKTEREDICIPLDDHGRMFVNWLHNSYNESFKHIEVVNFKYLDDSEEAISILLSQLGQMDMEGLSEADVELIDSSADILELYLNVVSMQSDMLARCEGFDINGDAIGGGLTDEDYSAYYDLKDRYCRGLADYAAALGLLNLEDGDVKDCVESLVNEIALYNENIDVMKEYVGDCFCIIGNSATGSVDYGVTPFQKRYANLGTHANVANTIIQKDFVKYVDAWWAILFAFLVALVIILITRKMSPVRTILFGLIYLVLPILICVVLMVGFRIFVPFASVVFQVLITYLFTVAQSFIATEKDKNTLRRGFDAYVAPEVVSEIVKNPQLLALGGSNRNMTALFSDVRTFSGFTECINREEGEENGAVRLVEILNGYLGKLSDAIMNQKGTIDKYVGDEIVSFFGAPVENPYNAYDACVAGIRMKQAEDIYNQEHLEELPVHPGTKTPFLLKSRVGINTGKMVVGNMGTEKKLNYTIMGNNVNLASRLEGTNKAYDSWIMCSESTWLEANSGINEGKLVSKMLDCVRVVNVEKPVQIYSIQGLRSEMKSEQIEGAELFNQGMEWYLKGRETPNGEKDLQDFMKAKKFFEQAYNCFHTSDPQDKSHISTEKKMILRCEDFLANGLPVDEKGIIKPWDGVYTMKSK